MSASALLLRLLLCVTLILNGSGVAVAAAGMELAHLSTSAGHGAAGAMPMEHARLATEASSDRMPCHEPDAATSAPVDRLASTPLDSGSPSSDPSDCCPASHCACVQHLAATVPQFQIRPTMVARAASHRPGAGAHPAPPVPHPIRPPIG